MQKSEALVIQWNGETTTWQIAKAAAGLIFVGEIFLSGETVMKSFIA